MIPLDIRSIVEFYKYTNLTYLELQFLVSVTIILTLELDSLQFISSYHYNSILII